MEGEYCSFTGRKIVQYGMAIDGKEYYSTKKLTPRTCTLNDGSTVTGIVCSEFDVDDSLRDQRDVPLPLSDSRIGQGRQAGGAIVRG